MRCCTEKLLNRRERRTKTIPFLLSAFSAVQLMLLFCGCKRETVAAPPGSGAKREALLIVSGDTAGWITPCGCTANQSGGLLRRGTYLEDSRKAADVAYADAGGAVIGNSPYQRVKFEAILRGEMAMGLVAHNVGRAEAELGADYLRDVAQR